MSVSFHQLQALQARLDRIKPLVCPPRLRAFTINEGEEHTLPDDLGPWDVVIKVEAPRHPSLR